MLFRKKENFDIEKFWKNYEESVGEKVLAKSLGQYKSGLAEFHNPLWGLVIATSGGFRFHHFPHESWLTALTRATSGGEGPKEKTFFIPKDTISSIELITENKWWKKILSPSNPVLAIQCNYNGETTVLIETDKSANAVADALRAS